MPEGGKIDFCEHFVKHPSNHWVTNSGVYAQGKTPEETRDEIIGLVKV